MEIELGVVPLPVFTIDDDSPVLLRGPPADPVAMAGVAESFGIELGVGK